MLGAVGLEVVSEVAHEPGEPRFVYCAGKGGGVEGAGQVSVRAGLVLGTPQWRVTSRSCTIRPGRVRLVGAVISIGPR